MCSSWLACQMRNTTQLTIDWSWVQEKIFPLQFLQITLKYLPTLQHSLVSISPICFDYCLLRLKQLSIKLTNTDAQNCVDYFCANSRITHTSIQISVDLWLAQIQPYPKLLIIEVRILAQPRYFSTIFFRVSYSINFYLLLPIYTVSSESLTSPCNCLAFRTSSSETPSFLA